MFQTLCYGRVIMARIKNITIDCEYPGRLATFWQAATGYSIEFSNEWIAYLGTNEPQSPRLLLLRVPEPKTVKNRTHIDLEADDRELGSRAAGQAGCDARGNSPYAEPGLDRDAGPRGK